MQVEQLHRLELGCKALDKLLCGGIESGVITLVYGEAGSGKTNFALQAAISCIKKGKKVIFVDTEGGFSAERFLQMHNNVADTKKILIIEPENFAQQEQVIADVEKIIARENISLIIIDSLVALWRLELNNDNARLLNKRLARNLAAFLAIARQRKIPIIATDQVWSSFKSRQLEMAAGDVPKFFCKCIIKLEKLGKGKRRAIIEKHRSVAEGQGVEFEIKNEGLIGLKKFRLF